MWGAGTWTPPAKGLWARFPKVWSPVLQGTLALLKWIKHAIHSIPFTQHLHLHCRICTYKEALCVPQKAYTISASGRQVLPQTLQSQKAAGVSPGNSHSQRPKAHLLCQLGAEVGHRCCPRTPAWDQGKKLNDSVQQLVKPSRGRGGSLCLRSQEHNEKKKSWSHTSFFPANVVTSL